MKKLYLIDASGYLYRSYFAIGSMTNQKGESTNALFGFIRSLQKLIQDFSPENLVCVFDGPNNGKKRLEIYPAYKAQRQSMPPDLRPQIDWAKDALDYLGIPYLNIKEAEADDVMGSIANWAKEHAEVYLCTADKDMAQLVDNRVFLLNSHKENLILDRQGVFEKFGIYPEQVIDYLAMIGDSSDNIKGLSGIGPKTASSLLSRYPSLHAIYEHLDEAVAPKKRSVFLEEKEAVFLAQKLVTIDLSVEIPKDPTFYRIKEPSLQKLKEFYQSMHFNSLLKSLEELFPGEKEEETTCYTLINTEEAFLSLIEELKKEKEICFDTETTDIHPLKASLVGIGFCFKQGSSFYVPLNGNIKSSLILEKLKPLFESNLHCFYGHNVKYDVNVLKTAGIDVKHLSFDTIIASFLLNPNQRNHSLDALSLERFNKVKISIKELIGSGKKQRSMLDVPLETVSTYCCEDVDYTFRLKQLFEKELKERGLDTLFHEIEIPLLPVLASMEQRGVFIDCTVLDSLSYEVTEDLSRLEKEILDLAGVSFNLNSPKQLSEILYVRLQIPPPKKISTGFSTDAETLEILAKKYPIASLLLEYRQLEKLRSTYIDALPGQINPKTGRIHCTFNQTKAATGRLSCQDPNLQNIPIRSPLGRKIREAFCPEDRDHLFLGADYSQIELRLLAHLSGDETLIEAFKNHLDIHVDTASKIFGVSVDEVTKEMRNIAKTVNFGIIYGQQAFGLSQELDCSVKEAQNFIDLYFKQYSRVGSFLQECKDKALQFGKSQTLYGRERPLPEILSKNRMLRQAAERLSVNSPIQGTAADMIKCAMINIHKKFLEERLESFMILQIHDELIFEVKKEELSLCQKIVKHEMESVLTLDVPLVVDIAVGKNWMEC